MISKLPTRPSSRLLAMVIFSALCVFASAVNAESFRRIVTGLDETGKAIVMFDNSVSVLAATDQPEVENIWMLEQIPAETSDIGISEISAAFGPEPQNLVFRIIDFPPSPPQEVLETLDTNMFMKIAGDYAPKKGLPSSHPFMHRTKTIDFAVVLSGEIEMVLDDSSVFLKAGDVIVQQETNHAWVNRGTEICRIAFVQVASTAE